MKTILLIEDNPEVRENTAEILELSNYRVLTAENGKLGVELALKEVPDLVICDIMMPVLDGYGVYHLLTKHEATASIPFIFLTAKSEKGDFRRGMEMGVDDYITKPFDGIELLTAIEVRLKKSDLLKSQKKVTIDHSLDGPNDAGKVHLLLENREVCGYEKKHRLYSMGQRPKAVYHVLNGKVKVYRVNDDGKEFITDIFSEGDYFGFIPVLDNTNYSDDAEILEDARLAIIPAAEFKQLVSGDRGVAEKFMQIVSRNVLGKEQNLLNLAYNSLRKKVAYGLIQLHDKYRGEGDTSPILNLSRENMAQTIGIATESLIRTLADFKEEKLVDIRSGKVVILDEQKLRNLPY